MTDSQEQQKLSKRKPPPPLTIKTTTPKKQEETTPSTTQLRPRSGSRKKVNLHLNLTTTKPKEYEILN